MDMPTRRLLLPLCLALAPLACTQQAQPQGGDGTGVAIITTPGAVPNTYPALGFDAHPDYIPDNVLVLTFDDGPDWNNTAKVLDVLKDKGVKASFYINTVNWSDVNMDAPMQALVHRMVDEGHELASHTVHHLHLPTLDASMIEDELAGVEDTVDTVMGAGAPRLTLFRAPFGEPYQDGNGYDLVAPIVAEHAVHIGWNFDTFDYNCPAGDSACVLNNFKNGVKTPGNGAWGIVLMHSVHAQTAGALPAIIDYARAKGFEFWTTEQVVCAKFGKSSSHIVDNTSGGCGVVPPPEPDAGPGPDPDIDAGEHPGQPDADIVDPPGSPDAGDTGGGDDDMSGNNGGTVGGCGCHAATRSGGGAGFWLLTPLALLPLYRRRRPRA